MIDHVNKLIFVHIPRTAGTSIEIACVGKDWWFIDKNSKHLSLREMKILYSNEWKNYTKFSIVRNPIDRFISLYASNHYGDYKNIENFLKFYKPKNHEQQYYNQIDILKPLTELDFILRYEYLNEDFTKMCKILGLSLTLQHYERSKKIRTDITLNDSVTDNIKKLYHKDFDFLYSIQIEVQAIFVQSCFKEIQNKKLENLLIRLCELEKFNSLPIIVFMDKRSENIKIYDNEKISYVFIEDSHVKQYASKIRHVFLNMMQYKTEKYRRVLLLETDCVITKSNFIEFLNEEIQISESFWIFGSFYHGSIYKKKLDRIHMNGVAVYNRTHDFLKFIESMNFGNTPYDYAISMQMKKKNIFRKYCINSNLICNLSPENDYYINFKNKKPNSVIVHQKIFKNFKNTVPTFVLITEYYLLTDKERQNEIDSCLDTNIKSNLFGKIVIFIEEKYLSEFNSKFSNENLEVVIICCRLTFKYAMSYANFNLNTGSIVVLSNNDIYYDESLHLTNELNLYVHFLSILRHDVSKSGSYTIFSKDGTPRSDSQDTWIFQIPVKIHDKSDFYFGKKGCDNRIAYLMNELGYVVLNPSLSIKCYHLHNSNYRKRTNEKVEGPYLNVIPSELN